MPIHLSSVYTDSRKMHPSETIRATRESVSLPSLSPTSPLPLWFLRLYPLSQLRDLFVSLYTACLPADECSPRCVHSSLCSNSPLTIDGPFPFIDSTFTCYPLYILKCISSPSLSDFFIVLCLFSEAGLGALYTSPWQPNTVDTFPELQCLSTYKFFDPTTTLTSDIACTNMKTTSLCFFFSPRV